MTRRTLLVVALVACNDGALMPAAPVPREPVTFPGLPVKVPRYVGVLTASESVEVAPRVAGNIAAVHVRVGDVVTVDQVIAELDPALLRIDLRAAEAAHTAAAATTRAANVEVGDARRRLLLETRAVATGVSPAQDLEEARVSVRRTEAALQRAQAVQASEASRAQAARDQLASSQLRAPFAGVVARRYRDAGNRVDAGAPIVRVDRRGSTRLIFAVPPQDGSRVVPGLRVQVTVETVAAPLAAVVEQVSPTIDPASGLIFIEAELVAGSLADELRSGLAAWVTFPAQTSAHRLAPVQDSRTRPERSTEQ
ncbi:MAG TPA: efflux RND transporter periplasmic adaptor subunit [Kofleriaceae bacterium]|nr:efflux RND transporter periplasmic adaptor subunit [Kofleriaceae bacterium]